MLLSRRTWVSALTIVLLTTGVVKGDSLFHPVPHNPPTAPRPAIDVDAVTASQPLTMRQHESLRAALLRVGLDAREANRAADALADDFDTVNPHPGLTLRVSLSGPLKTGAGLQLLGLEVTPRDNDHLMLSRETDGGFTLRRAEAAAFSTPNLTRGVVHGSLYLSIVEAGVSPDVAAKIVDLFGRRVDLSRDIVSGDRFRLVFDPGASSDPRRAKAENLLYADLTTASGQVQLYRFQPEDARAPQWVDGKAGPASPSLLRTPLEGAHVTSAFGMRMHPLLGFTRMHEGVDFGAAVGSPVLAAGDGVVEEARWASGYGRWLKIRHSADLETGYGHLLAWSPGVAPGAHVRQGQVVAFVGESGLATGPHLHYEVFQAGRRIDPKLAPTLTPSRRDIARDPDFRAHKADIDAAVASLTAACAVPGLVTISPATRCVG